MSNLIPEANALFAIWVNIFFDNLGAILVRIGFPDDVFGNLDRLRSIYVEANAVAKNPATRTKAAVQARKEARKVFEKALRQAIAEYLTYNHKVTNEDRENLGLPIQNTIIP
ncbi:MAG: hypothetical protein LBS16_04625 [Prevotellaceae bacterium]|jgi:hypothetical protein|nr:hypothetical protein [Prevotellaceae bacterium]